jgi:hypothetical protein
MYIRIYVVFTSSIFVLQLSGTEFAQVNMAMPAGWSQNIPDKHLKWQRLPMENKPFEVRLRNGLVSNTKR